jgi:hypothetical protein
MLTVLQKRDIKCRVYENDIETWVPDLNGNIQRKETNTIVINFKSELD